MLVTIQFLYAAEPYPPLMGRERPLWVKSGHSGPVGSMAALRQKRS
jgi:hypothetical protein